MEEERKKRKRKERKKKKRKRKKETAGHVKLWKNNHTSCSRTAAFFSSRDASFFARRETIGAEADVEDERDDNADVVGSDGDEGGKEAPDNSLEGLMGAANDFWKCS